MARSLGGEIRSSFAAPTGNLEASEFGTGNWEFGAGSWQEWRARRMVELETYLDVAVLVVMVVQLVDELVISSHLNGRAELRYRSR